jgi:hypothetical protein
VKISHRPRKVKYESSSDKITSFAGLKLATDLAHKLGIIRGLEALTVKKRRRGIPMPDFVMSLVHNFLVGGQHLTDLRVLRDEEATRGNLYDLEVPAPTTAGEGLRKFTLGHIKQVEKIIGDALRTADGWIGGGDTITLDLDSSIFQVYGYFKEGARYAYNQMKGFHPLLCFWAETRLLIGARLRSGNRTSAHRAISFLKECLSRLPQDRVICLRMDAGFYAREIVEFLQERGLEFSISGRLTSALRAAIEALPDTAWKPYPWEEETEYAELSYQPSGWPRPFRMLVKRQPLYEGHQLLLGQYFYTPVITDRRGAAPSLLRHHLARGGSENYIEEFKNGVGARLLPSERFVANWVWLVIAQLAYNLGQWFKLLVLPSRSHGHQFKKLRLHWFCVAGRVIRSGRQVKIALARGIDIVERFARAQAAIFAL